MGYLKRFFCWMGWHSYFSGYDDVRNDPDDFYCILKLAKCKWCGYVGNVDSQGNLF